MKLGLITIEPFFSQRKAQSWLFFAVFATSLLGASGSYAAPKARPPASDLKAIMARPGTLRDQAVVVTGMQCVDDRGPFICIRRVGGALLKLRGSSIGADAPQRDVEHFNAECSGSINLERNACKFDVQLSRIFYGERETVDIDGSSAVVITLRGMEIDFWRPAE